MSDAVQPVPLKIDIVSDVVCPWCIIGYKQLLKALDTLSDEFEPTIAWHPFELNPNMPEEGQDLREHLAMKYGTNPEQSKGARSRLTELGESLGFTFDYFEGMRMVNTFRAHQLLHWAGPHGLQTELKLALFTAFFTERKDVSQTAVLVEAAGAVGLDAAEAAALLADGRYASAVREEQGQWLEQEVYAVPTFFFQDRFPVPGAQESATFERVLKKIYARSADSAA
ncbi:MAG: DsbA family oxidoreductase [Halioglobus sp.]|nr:DsbA family oxidoreductase [Halioglobus sp.]